MRYGVTVTLRMDLAGTGTATVNSPCPERCRVPLKGQCVIRTRLDGEVTADDEEATPLVVPKLAPPAESKEAIAAPTPAQSVSPSATVAESMVGATTPRRVQHTRLASRAPDRRRRAVLPHGHASVAPLLRLAAREYPQVIQDRLGHASIAQTFDVYGHLFPATEDRTREAIERAFAAPAHTSGEWNAGEVREADLT